MHDEPVSAPQHPQRRAFRKALRTACDRAARKLQKLRDELAQCADAEEVLQAGEILKANLDALRRGMSEATLPDPYHPGQTRTITLDPVLKPLENASRYFTKHRKLRKGLDNKEREIELCRQDLETLQALCAAYETWEAEAAPESPPPDDLLREAAKHRVHVQGLPSAPNGPTGRAAKRTPASGVDADVRRYTSHDGWALLVGQSARDNDTLTKKIAKGQDWWFHVAHYAGSHVVARPPDGFADPGDARGQKIADKQKKRAAQPGIPQETLLDAAHLAVHFSKAREASRPEVHYTQAKHVHKPKGAPAGQVVLNQFKSVTVRIEQARLNRLLARHG